MILALDDLAYTAGPLLVAASPIHALTAFVAVLMTGIVIVGFVFRPEHRLFRTIGWVSLSLIAVYVTFALTISFQLP